MLSHLKTDFCFFCSKAILLFGIWAGCILFFQNGLVLGLLLGGSQPVWYQIERHQPQLLLQISRTLTLWHLTRHFYFEENSSFLRDLPIHLHFILSDSTPSHFFGPRKQNCQLLCLRPISSRFVLQRFLDLFCLLPARSISSLLFQGHCSYLCFLVVSNFTWFVMLVKYYFLCFWILVIYYLVKVNSINWTFFCRFSFCLLSRTIWSRSIVSS